MTRQRRGFHGDVRKTRQPDDVRELDKGKDAARVYAEGQVIDDDAQPRVPRGNLFDLPYRRRRIHHESAGDQRAALRVLDREPSHRREAMRMRLRRCEHEIVVVTFP